MNRKHLLVFLLLISINVFAQVNEYNFDILRKIGFFSGNESPGYLGHDMGPPRFPQSFAVKDNQIIVNDNVERRIIIYDLNLNYIKEIKSEETKFVGVVMSLVVDDKQSIYFYSPIDRGVIIKFNIDTGKTIYKINTTIDITADDLYPLGDFTYFYYNDEIRCIDPDGNILEQEKAKEILAQQDGYLKGFFTETKYNSEFIHFLTQNNLIFVNDRLFIRDIDSYNSYVTLIKKCFKGKKISRDILPPNLPNITLYYLCNFDMNNNYFFRGMVRQGSKTYPIIVVYSKYGQLLDRFYCYGFNVAIAPNGDIWGLEIDEENEIFIFKKLTARWGID